MNPMRKSESKHITRSENLRLQDIWGERVQQIGAKFAKRLGNKKMPVRFCAVFTGRGRIYQLYPFLV